MKKQRRRLMGRIAWVALSAMTAFGSSAEAQSQSCIDQVLPATSTSNDSGDAVSVYNGWMAVCSPALRMYREVAGVWTMVQQPEHPGLPALERSIEMDGQTMAVTSNEFLGTGEVHVYTEDAGLWTLQAELSLPDGFLADSFGFSLGLHADRLAVGSPYDDISPNADQGSVQMFTRSGDTWSLGPRITAADGATGDGFGSGLALEGDTLLVGAPGDKAFGLADAGSVYVFEFDGTQWSQQQKLLPSVLTVSDQGPRFAKKSCCAVARP